VNDVIRRCHDLCNLFYDVRVVQHASKGDHFCHRFILCDGRCVISKAQDELSAKQYSKTAPITDRSSLMTASLIPDDFKAKQVHVFFRTDAHLLARGGQLLIPCADTFDVGKQDTATLACDHDHPIPLRIEVRTTGHHLTGPEYIHTDCQLVDFTEDYRRKAWVAGCGADG